MNVSLVDKTIFKKKHYRETYDLIIILAVAANLKFSGFLGNVPSFSTSNFCHLIAEIVVFAWTAKVITLKQILRSGLHNGASKKAGFDCNRLCTLDRTVQYYQACPSKQDRNGLSLEQTEVRQPLIFNKIWIYYQGGTNVRSILLHQSYWLVPLWWKCRISRWQNRNC